MDPLLRKEDLVLYFSNNIKGKGNTYGARIVYYHISTDNKVR